MKPRELPIFKNWQGGGGTLEAQQIGEKKWKRQEKLLLRGKTVQNFEEGPETMANATGLSMIKSEQ